MSEESPQAHLAHGSNGSIDSDNNVEKPLESLTAPVSTSGAKAPNASIASQAAPCNRSLFWRCLRGFILFSLAILIVITLFGAAAGYYVWHEAKRRPAPPLLDSIPFSTELYSAEGELLRITPASDGIWRIRTRLSDIDPKLIDATLFYEDRSFRNHFGINPLSLLRAGVQALQGGRRMGASTLTMQLARMRLHLSTDTPEGKVRQMWHALRYEAHYSKDEILEAYLNLAPYGGNVEGVGAATRVWFGRTAKRLTAGQATMLAVIPQNPVRRRPVPSREGTNATLNTARIRLSNALLEAGLLPKRLRSTIGAPVMVTGTADLPFLAPHFTAMTLTRLKTLAKSKDARGLAATTGPIQTTLRLPLQTTLENLLHDTVNRLRVRGVRNAAIAVADARDRSLLALVGSANWYDPAIAGEVNAWNALRSPGSTLKPFVYGLAVDQGLIHGKTILIDRPQSFGGWAPENADGTFEGPVTAEDALVRSRNLPAVDLERRLTPNLWTLLKSAGVPLAHDAKWYGLSIVLGGAEVRMRDLMTLYCALNDDARIQPIRYLVGDHPPTQGQLFSPEAAFAVRQMLASRGTFISAGGARRTLLYKTGTSNGWRDAWAAGAIGPYTIVVWLGDFAGAPNPQLQGARIAAPLLRAAAARIAADPTLSWSPALTPQEEAKRRTLRVSEESVCAATGDLDTSLCSELVKTWILPGKTSMRNSGVFRKILLRDSTGLRACTPGEGVRTVVWEFWPTHFQALFHEAGIVKRPPPPFEAGCERAAQLEGRTTTIGTAPEILSPKTGVILRIPPGRTTARIVLRAGTDADAKLLYWYDGANFIGVSPAGKALPWRVEAGEHRLTATDELGRNASITFQVKH